MAKSFTPYKISWSLMSAKKFSLKSVAPILLCSGALVGLAPHIAEAQSNPGFSFIWGGGDSRPNRQLSYNLENGTPGHLNDRWHFNLSDKERAISSIQITFPDYFDGRFRENKIELREAPKNRIFNLRKGKTIAVSSVTYNKDSNRIDIVPAEPIPAGKKVQAVFKNVKNPRSGGMYFVNCAVSSPGDEVPLPRVIGTWVLSIFRS